MSIKDYSGKFVVRVDTDLHSKLRRSANRDGVSLNQKCLQLLSQVENCSVSTRKKNPYSIIEDVFKDSLLGLVLFGSVARGEARHDSDEDLLLVVRNDIPINRGLYKVWDKDIAPSFPENLAPHFVHLPEIQQQVGGLWLEVAIDGLVLFDQSKTISNCLRSIRQRIAEGVYQRKLSNGHPYWIYNDKEMGNAEYRVG